MTMKRNGHDSGLSFMGLFVSAFVIALAGSSKDTRIEDARSRAEERKRQSELTIEKILAQTKQEADEIVQEVQALGKTEVESNLRKMQDGLKKLRELEMAAVNEKAKHLFQAAAASLSEKIAQVQRQI